MQSLCSGPCTGASSPGVQSRATPLGVEWMGGCSPPIWGPPPYTTLTALIRRLLFLFCETLSCRNNKAGERTLSLQVYRPSQYLPHGFQPSTGIRSLGSLPPLRRLSLRRTKPVLAGAQVTRAPLVGGERTHPSHPPTPHQLRPKSDIPVSLWRHVLPNPCDRNH